MPIGFGAEEEAYAYRTGRAAPAPPTIVGPARAVVQARINAANTASVQQRIATGINVPQPSGVGYWAPIAPPPPPPPPEPPRRPISAYQDPYFQGSSNDPFRLFQLSPLANIPNAPLTGFEVFDQQRQKELSFRYATPEEQEKFANKSRENREVVNLKNDAIREVEQKQAKDANLPAEERQALHALKLQLIEMKASDATNVLNPIRIMIKNLGVRADYRIQLAEWKKGKTRTTQALPNWFPQTGEEFDEMGGLGGFITGSQSKTAGDFDRTPAIFGKLITRDANGQEIIVDAMDWIAARIADTKPLPSDTPEERARKSQLAADWMATLAFADKYNSFAQKRDAGYRIQLDANGRPIAGYLLKPDEDAMKNLVGEILSDMATHNIVGPIEEWIEAYAIERDIIADNATGVYGTGQSSGSGGGGGGYYYGGGGGGYGGGGGGGGYGFIATDPALLKMMVDSIARARMGRSLTAEEAQEFINFYNSMERGFWDSRSMGGDSTRLDPEAQAVAWIESRMNKEAAGQQAGKFVVALMNMIRTGNFSAS